MVVIQKLYPEIIRTCRPLIVEDEVLRLLAKKFSESVGKSLSGEQQNVSAVKCNLTHVEDFPDGTENGNFIGLDFSGKIFRLVYVGLKGDRSVVTESKLYEFPCQKLKEGVNKVMDYVARCVNNFIETFEICDKKTIMGVASSFPMEQDSLQEAKILDWGRDFHSDDLLDHNFFIQLKISLKKFKYTKGIYLISMVSNSTACLMSGLYKDPGTRIGVYLGEGTNLSYLERYKNITAYAGDGLRSRTALGVDMKNFGDDGLLDFIRTDLDLAVDSASDSPGQFVLEKMVSATYLGEIARLYLYKVASEGIILGGHVTPALSMRDGLKTADMAMMETDDEKTFIRCKAVMYNLGYSQVSDEDCLQIRFVCRCVARRSSNLVAACLTAMLHRMETKDVHIVADGSLIKDFPNYENYLVKKINQLKKPEIRYWIRKAVKEEVGIGAGLVALIYKDETTKLEDKHRVLPPFNPNKYHLADIPASCIDCECEPVRSRPNKNERPATARKEVEDADQPADKSEFTEPVFVTSLEVAS